MEWTEEQKSAFARLRSEAEEAARAESEAVHVGDRVETPEGMATVVEEAPGGFYIQLGVDKGGAGRFYVPAELVSKYPD